MEDEGEGDDLINEDMMNDYRSIPQVGVCPTLLNYVCVCDTGFSSYEKDHSTKNLKT